MSKRHESTELAMLAGTSLAIPDRETAIERIIAQIEEICHWAKTTFRKGVWTIWHFQPEGKEKGATLRLLLEQLFSFTDTATSCEVARRLLSVSRPLTRELCLVSEFVLKDLERPTLRSLLVETLRGDDRELQHTASILAFALEDSDSAFNDELLDIVLRSSLDLDDRRRLCHALLRQSGNWRFNVAHLLGRVGLLEVIVRRTPDVGVADLALDKLGKVLSIVCTYSHKDERDRKRGFSNDSLAQALMVISRTLSAIVGKPRKRNRALGRFSFKAVANHCALYNLQEGIREIRRGEKPPDEEADWIVSNFQLVPHLILFQHRLEQFLESVSDEESRRCLAIVTENGAETAAILALLYQELAASAKAAVLRAGSGDTPAEIAADSRTAEERPNTPQDIVAFPTAASSVEELTKSLLAAESGS